MVILGFIKNQGGWTYRAVDCNIGIGNTTVNITNTQSSSCPYPFADAALLSNKDFYKSELSIYLNPASNGLVNIKFQLSGVTNIALFDILGRNVSQTKLNSDVLDVRAI